MSTHVISSTFFSADENIYQMILSHTLGKNPNQSLIKKNQMLLEIKLLDRTKVYYRFNAKGVTFNVFPKTNRRKKKYLAAFYGQLIAHQITFLKHPINKDFVRNY